MGCRVQSVTLRSKQVGSGVGFGVQGLGFGVWGYSMAQGRSTNVNSMIEFGPVGCQSRTRSPWGVG